jgi:hypothetical protein
MGREDGICCVEEVLPTELNSEMQVAARDEAVVRLCLQSLEGSLLATQKSFEDRIQQRFDALESMVKAMDSKTEQQSMEVDKRLEAISEAVGIKPKVNSGDDDEDRKRLKERFKEALNHQKEHTVGEIEVEGYSEYFFGICKPNGRLGKRGSRLLGLRWQFFFAASGFLHYFSIRN